MTKRDLHRELQRVIRDARILEGGNAKLMTKDAQIAAQALNAQATGLLAIAVLFNGDEGDDSDND